MAVTLNANTSTGFIATSDTSGVLQLQTGGTAAVTVDASQNVGIGTSSPVSKLHIESTSAEAFQIGYSSTKRARLGVTSSGDLQIYAYDPAVGYKNIQMCVDAGTASGKLLVGTTAPVIGRMTVSGGIDSVNYPQFNIYSTNSSTDFEWVLRSGQRQLYYVNNATVVASLSLTGVWTNASDARYKENITDSQYGLATVMALKPRAYNLIDQADKPQIGFIAQEVLDVVPEVVDSVHNSVTDEDRYTLSYGNMVAVLTKAIQEQQAIIQTLTDRITALEGTTP